MEKLIKKKYVVSYVPLRPEKTWLKTMVCILMSYRNVVLILSQCPALQDRCYHRTIRFTISFNALLATDYKKTE